MDENVVNRGRAAVVVVDRRNQPERVADHDEELRHTVVWILQTDDATFPVIWSDRELSVCFALVQPNLAKGDRPHEYVARAELPRSDPSK